MKMLMKKLVKKAELAKAALGLLLFVFAMPLLAGDALSINTVSVGISSFYGNYTILESNDKAMLIDAPFARSDAMRVAAEILDSGKNLDTIYVTHDHPDHFFSVDLLASEFPSARVLAHPQVVKDIWRTFPIKLERWGPLLGNNLPKYPMIPEAIKEKSFKFDSHTIEIIGPFNADHARSTVLWLPQEKILIAGDVAFYEVHAWFGEHTAEDRLAWIKTLNQLIALKPEKVILGHQNPAIKEVSFDPKSLAWTRDYIIAVNEEIAKAKDSQDLKARIIKRYPNAATISHQGMMFDISCKVAMGEMPPWAE